MDVDAPCVSSREGRASSRASLTQHASRHRRTIWSMGTSRRVGRWPTTAVRARRQLLPEGVLWKMPLRGASSLQGGEAMCEDGGYAVPRCEATRCRCEDGRCAAVAGGANSHVLRAKCSVLRAPCSVHQALGLWRTCGPVRVFQCVRVRVAYLCSSACACACGIHVFQCVCVWHTCGPMSRGARPRGWPAERPLHSPCMPRGPHVD